MDELVKKITLQVFSSVPTNIEEIKGKGKNNLVFKIVVNENPIILRLNNRERTLELYQKEKWCAEVVKDAGIPTPQILEVGTCDNYVFSFQEFIEGTNGTEAGSKISEIWFTLGKYANIIHKIPAPDLRLDYEKFIQDMFSDDFFVKRGIFSQELSSKIQSCLEETTTWSFSPMLCHGNLHPSNVMLDPAGIVHLIDWESATGNTTPQAELAEIYTWNTGKENIAHFLRGHGLSENDVKEMMRDIQTLILLRLVHVIVRKMPKDDNWEQDTYIKETSLRLSDINDYQQDILFTKNI